MAAQRTPKARRGGPSCGRPNGAGDGARNGATNGARNGAGNGAARGLRRGALAAAVAAALPAALTSGLSGGFSGGLVASASAVALLAASAPALAQDAPVVRRVERILVEGAQRVDDATIQAYMTVQVGEPATAAQINESLRRLLDTGLFQDVTISPMADGLLVQVREAPYINLVTFEGNEELEDDVLIGSVTSASRAAFSRATADRDAQTLLDLYRRAGRYGATVEPVIIERENNRVDLVFEIDEGEPTGIRSIDFVGNREFSDSRLRSAIQTRENGLLAWIFSTGTYDPDRLEYDKELLRRYYLDHGYADFEVLSATAELAADREDFLITFTVSEGEQYTFGDLGLDIRIPGVDPESFTEIFPMEPGEIYSISDVDTAIDNLIFQLGQQGYAFVDVNPRADKDVENRVIGVTLEVAEGPRVYVERIDIEGNTRTLDRVIRREFGMAEGDAYNAQEVQQARNRLRELGFFETVEVRPERGSADDRAVIKTTVEERLTGSISFGVGFSSEYGPLGDLTISERNFLGRGQFVSATVTVSGDTQQARLLFEEPRLLDRDLTGGFDIGWLRDDRTDYSSYKETRLQFLPYLEFPVGEDQRLQTRLRLSQDEIRDVLRYASPAIQADEGDEFYMGVGATWTLDQRDDPVEPAGGYIIELSEDVTAMGSSTVFSRTVARAKAYQGFFDDEVVASIEAEAGALFSAGDGLRVTDRFFLGGDSFRGFGTAGIGPRDDSTTSFVRIDPATGKPQKPIRRFNYTRDDALGGNYYAVLRSDLSFPIGLPEEFGVYGGVFADVGTLFGLDRTTYPDRGGRPDVTIDDSMSLRASVGAALYIDSAFGPLRFNFAYPLAYEDSDDREFFRFTVGTRF